MGKYQVELTDQAIENLQAGYEYYDNVRANLGFDFFAEM